MTAHATPEAHAEKRVDGRPPVNVSAYPPRSILQAPVWTWEVPAYFFTGGLAAASAMVAFGADLVGNTALGRRAKLLALTAVGVSPLLLISDLARPRRFYNMMRVFRPTSPMNLGTWILSAFGGATAAAAAAELAPAPLRPLGRLATGAAAMLAPPLATYTGVLVAQTSVPVWHKSRHHLPLLFAASASASAGGLLSALTPTMEAGPARALAVGGGLGELLVAELMQRNLGAEADVYREGPAGAYGRLARLASATGAAAILIGGRRSWLARTGGLLLGLGALSLRFSVWRAGIQSARQT